MNRRISAVVLVLVLLLSGCGAASPQAPTTQTAPAANPLGLDPAPFGNGTTAKYEWLDASGAVIGTSQFQFALAGNAWTLTETDTIGELEQTATVQVDAATLQPQGEHKTIKSSTLDVDLTTTYKSGTLSITAVVNGETQTASLDVPGNTIDNDQLLMTLRALPFAQGYTAKYVVVNAQNALKVDATVTVQAQASVPVPAGTYETWPVTLEAGGGTQQIWYEVAAPHELIQYNNGATRLVLVSP